VSLLVNGIVSATVDDQKVPSLTARVKVLSGVLEAAGWWLAGEFSYLAYLKRKTRLRVAQVLTGLLEQVISGIVLVERTQDPKIIKGVSLGVGSTKEIEALLDPSISSKLLMAAVVVHPHVSLLHASVAFHT